jgi:hypothetical protein
VDWFLSITTLAVNWSLGWFKGKWWLWLIHALNASLWIAYSLAIEQYGLILLSIVTVAVDLASGIRQFSLERKNKTNEG